MKWKELNSPQPQIYVIFLVIYRTRTWTRFNCSRLCCIVNENGSWIISLCMCFMNLRKVNWYTFISKQHIGNYLFFIIHVSIEKLSLLIKGMKHIDGVMVILLVSSVVDCGFEPRSGQTKDYKIGICCFSAKHAALTRRKSKDWLARNQDNVVRHVYPQTVVSVN